MIAPASPDDAEGAAALLDAVHAHHVHTPAGVRYRIETASPDDRMAWWKVEVGEALVGWGLAGLDTFSSVPRSAFAVVAVHPEHRGRGHGSGLWAAALQHLDEIGAVRIRTESHADDASKRFAVAHGFRLLSTESTSAVDPRTLPAPPPPPDPIELRPLSAFADDPRPVFRADAESALDEPGPFDFSGMTFESWQRRIWNHPDCDHDLGIAAVIDEVVAGTTFLFTDRRSGRAMNGGTGVLRDYRGRGVGLLIKQHSLARAADAGITTVATNNDDTNAPMLAINRRLGYRPLATGHVWTLER